MINKDICGSESSNLTDHHFYLGWSMQGTFRPGDWLQVEREEWAKIRIGDIVVFKARQGIKQDYIVHRVFSRTCGALITRGDANPRIDDCQVTETDLIGRVAAFTRAGRKRAVLNGFAGRLHVKGVRMKKALIHYSSRPFSPILELIRNSDWITKLNVFRIDEVHFETSEGMLVKFVHNGKTVGTWWPDRNQLICGRWHKLLLWTRLRPK